MADRGMWLRKQTLCQRQRVPWLFLPPRSPSPSLSLSLSLAAIVLPPRTLPCVPVMNNVCALLPLGSTCAARFVASESTFVFRRQLLLSFPFSRSLPRATASAASRLKRGHACLWRLHTCRAEWKGCRCAAVAVSFLPLVCLVLASLVCVCVCSARSSCPACAVRAIVRQAQRPEESCAECLAACHPAPPRYFASAPDGVTACAPTHTHCTPPCPALP